MPAIRVMPAGYEDQYLQALELYVSAVEKAEADGNLGDKDIFVSLLDWGLREVGPAADLAQEEEISKTSISKWLNSKSVPPAPTRKTVFNWLKRRAQARLGHSNT